MAVEIQHQKDAGKVPYFSAIAKELESEISPSTVHTALDRLIDLGTISANWAKVGSKWVREFYIAGESKRFINKIASEVYE